MKKIFTITLLLGIFMMYNPVLAQTIQITSGTRVPITVKSEYNSKNVISGQQIDAIIEDDINIKGVNVFKKGDPACINVSEVKKAGFVGIPGEMYLVNGEIIDANGNKHIIEYNQKITGEEKTWPKVCLGCGCFIILAPLVLFGFVKGGQAKIYPSKVIDVALRNDFEFAPAKL